MADVNKNKEYPYIILPLLLPKNEIIQSDIPYVGLYYAGKAEGAFWMEEGAHYIELIRLHHFEQYDMTNAIQIGFDVRILNEKLKLLKSDDHTIISSQFENGQFPFDTISITVNELLSQINIDSVISFEPWKYIMDNFTDYVANYFNGTYIINHEPPLTKETFVQLFKNIKSSIKGEIKIKFIQSLLEDFIAYNPFENRLQNEGLEYGFMSGDLLYIPNGLSITLTMNILSPTKPITVNDLVINSNKNCFCDCKPKIQIVPNNNLTVITPTDIKYTVTTPLLLKLIYPII